MPIIRITDEANSLIRAHVQPGYTFRQTGTKNADGTWDIPLEPETLDRVYEHMLPGETISDCIVRMFAELKGLN